MSEGLNDESQKKAVNCFSQKLHCSQAVLAAFAKECGITEEEVLSLAVVLAAVCERGKCVEL